MVPVFPGKNSYNMIKTLPGKGQNMSPYSFADIDQVQPDQEEQLLPAFIHLLQDTVDGGASVGFLPPLDEESARVYWRGVFRDLAEHTRILLVARVEGQVVGSVQLELATKANALHRAEVQKLFVLQSQRRQGLGRALMQSVEEVARACGRSLLVLDTRQGDTAEQLYRSLGYCEVGVIPAFARSATGTLDGTIFFYKQL
jgi:ribosomal protein S18 acetylase RimI-like enzyme